MEIRSLPSEPVADWVARLEDEAARLTREMEKRQPGTGITIHPRSTVPGCAEETDGKAEAFLRRLTGDNAKHVVAYGTEAWIFQAAGYSTAVFGPGSVAQAHQPDEFIATSELIALDGFLDRLIADLSTQ